ncbi:hypothetical protein BI364_11465 [Acidihalobacter yilgarnensis]|uniref:Basal-body rod modification protein FlgD n=1 Tax=Acidihalobacter yilgarnensis TaxID=2819280 RepID=A0A1D8IPQ1_9GAMM|nr:flagellar hook assembly protein FlgD [Acidihalobacter yilgarnensis]AOU98488.1 hypothetical protein BI364_11465 [Acidihalobacter yilgarnensis]
MSTGAINSSFNPSVLAQLGLTGSTTSSSSATSGTGSSGSQLGQQAFLNLMVAELKNQDPTQPMSGQNMLAQLAQFSTVSGIQSMSTSFATLSKSLSTNQSLQAASLVGRTVLAPSSMAVLPASGSLQGSVDVTTPASQVSVGIYDTSGQLVKQMDLGTQAQGLANFSWDGTNMQGTPMPAGTYEVKAVGQVNGQSQGLGVLSPAQVSSVTLAQNGGPITLALSGGMGNVDLSQIRQIS